IGGYFIVRSSRAASVSGDINGDGVVNVYDLSILLSNWGSANTAADLNHDGTVSIFDLSVLLSHWGQSGSPTPSPTGTPTANTCPSPTPVAPVTGYTISACEDFNSGLGAFGPYSGGGGSTTVGVGRTPSQCTVTGGMLQLKQAS